MSTPTWTPGTLYNPGALVTPRTAPPVGTDPPTNADFESGDTGWTKGTGWSITNADGSFDGSWAGVYPSQTGANVLENNLKVDVTPGLVINAQCMVNTTGNSVSQGGAAIRVNWYDASDVFITTSEGNIVRGGGNAWYASGVTATAPATAAKATIAINAFRNSGSHNILVDAFTWDYAFTTPPAGIIYKAVQTNAGFSANTEPTWPTVLGNTVVDGDVTWEAVVATQVIYAAHAILKSGDTEPTWPTVIGGSVVDGTIIWQAVSGVITDPKCPNTAAVAIGASKVFASDRDIIPFCATVNPLDWSTANDAGYLPFGLQTYGSQPVSALGLYRGNLVAFNATGFQMWQIDQDPANMAILDSVPVSCTYPRTVQPLANDLVFLNPKGVRNISIAGASTNLQANGVGQPIDALVQADIKAGTYEPIGLYWPFMGQYWLIFGPNAYVLTINGANQRSWSRYTFPAEITDWTLDGDSLVLRMGDTILQMDSDVVADDVRNLNTFTAGTLSATTGYAKDAFGTLIHTDMNASTQGTFNGAIINVSNQFVVALSGLIAGNPEPTSVSVYSGSDATALSLIAVLDVADATRSVIGDVISWTWTTPGFTFTDESDYTITLTPTLGAFTDFTGLIQWPHLDLGALGREKQLVGVDVVADAPNGIEISVGYDQRDLTARTTPYAIDADTLPAQMVPIPVSGPSFDLQVTFPAGQAWEFQAACLYVQDWRVTS